MDKPSQSFGVVQDAIPHGWANGVSFQYDLLGYEVSKRLQNARDMPLGP